MDKTNLFETRIDNQTGDDSWEFGWRTAERFSDDGDSCYVARFLISQLKGNDAPYISRPSFSKWVKGIPTFVDSDESMLRNVFPELAPLMDVHLASTVTGQPMHYVANARYWAAAAMGVSRWPIDTGHDPRVAFRRQVIAGIRMDDEARMVSIFAPIHVSPPKGIIFEQYAESKAGLDEQRDILDERVRSFCDHRAFSLKNHMEDILKRFKLNK
jgi:hypothetical protein